MNDQTGEAPSKSQGGQGGQGGQWGQAEAEDRLRRGSSFGVAAAAYAEHRPDYAEAAVRWALEPVWDHRPVRVVEIGAGTGKLTAMLVRRDRPGAHARRGPRRAVEHR